MQRTSKSLGIKSGKHIHQKLRSHCKYNFSTSFAVHQDIIKKSPIYTRTGDQGTSSLYDGSRKSKDDDVFEALGTVDELNASLGLACELCKTKEVKEQLSALQSLMLDIGSAIATPIDSGNEKKLARVQFNTENIEILEKWIDVMDSKLPPLRNFILPSGGLGASQIHVARTICRRAERRVVSLVRENKVDPVVQRYLNRLSDYLFVAARYVASSEGYSETVYKKQ